MFAAKEVFYKRQFPLTSQWVNFHDIEVKFIGRGDYSGDFELIGGLTAGMALST